MYNILDRDFTICCLFCICTSVPDLLLFHGVSLITRLYCFVLIVRTTFMSPCFYTGCVYFFKIFRVNKSILQRCFESSIQIKLITMDDFICFKKAKLA